jgi:hypothetical protein
MGDPDMGLKVLKLLIIDYLLCISYDF